MTKKIFSIFFTLFVSLIIALMLMLSGCEKASHVRQNIRLDADNFKIRRRVIAINTRLNETLFMVEGYISLDIDSDGDLNVLIQTGDNEYKLFYAHLSADVTYTSIQLEGASTTPYAYNISFFPLAETLTHGLFDTVSTEREEE